MKSFRCPAVASWRVLSALFVLAGCVATPVSDGVYELDPEDSLTLVRDTTLTYDSFSDSRCPPTTPCVWAGQLLFRFVVDGPGGHEEFTLSPDRPAAVPKSLHGLRIALDAAQVPPARAGVNAPPRDSIPVTLTITSPKPTLPALPALLSPPAKPAAGGNAPPSTPRPRT